MAQLHASLPLLLQTPRLVSSRASSRWPWLGRALGFDVLLLRPELEGLTEGSRHGDEYRPLPEVLLVQFDDSTVSRSKAILHQIEWIRDAERHTALVAPKLAAQREVHVDERPL
jgi:hypothetical protein